MQRLGQRFENIDTSLAAIFNVSESVRTEIDQSGKRCFRDLLPDAYGMQSRTHTIASRRGTIGVHLA
jgi:hypothetical protein